MIATTSTIESAVVATSGLGGVVNVILSGALAMILARQARTVGRGRTPRFARTVQALFVGMYVIDLLVRLGLSQGPPLLVPTLVRLAVPLAVLVLLRRERR